MTSPIPIEPVHIQPQFAETQQVQPAGIDVLISALRHRQDLNLRQQELQKEMEQLEINKKLAGPQYANSIADYEKKKRDLQREQDRQAAEGVAQRLFVGSLPHIDDPKAMGEVLAGIKDPDVGAAFNNLLKEHWTNEGLRQSAQPTFDVKPTATPNSPTGYTYTGINQKNPSQTTATGLAAPNPQAPVQRIPVVTEREKASAAVGAAQANSTINRLETADPQIGARVARKVATQRSVVGALAKRLVGVPPDDIAAAQEATIEGNLSPDELAYYQAQKQWLGSVLPGLSGKQVTSREYMMQAPPYFSMGASTPQVVQNRRKARATRTRGFIAEAGDAMQERLGEIPDLGEYGLGGPAPAAGATVNPAGRYHPKFNQP